MNSISVATSEFLYGGDMKGCFATCLRILKLLCNKALVWVGGNPVWDLLLALLGKCQFNMEIMLEKTTSDALPPWESSLVKRDSDL